MSASITYRVLWVDDQNADDDFVLPWARRAEEYNIELVSFSNWEEAESELQRNYDDYSAIILDAYCKIKPDDVEQEEFITAVLPSLTVLFGEKRRLIPWFILSAGTMDNFGNTMNGARYQHSKYVEEWGEMLYKKTLGDDSIFCNIARLAKSQANNVVLFRHPKLFDYMGDGKIIDKRARTIMLRMLSALYFPEENIGFQYEGNPLRKVIEYMFRSAKNYGLLAEGCIDKQGRIVLLDASRFMAGKDVKIYNGKDVVSIARWGNPSTSEKANDGDTIFPNEIANMIQNTLNFAGVESHTVEGDDNSTWQVNNQSVEQFFAYVMMVCHVIGSFGRYVEAHSDIEANKSNIRVQPYSSVADGGEMSEYEGKSFAVEQDEKGNYHCGHCILSFTAAQNYLGKSVTLTDVQLNSKPTKNDYPYFAKFTPLN